MPQADPKNPISVDIVYQARLRSRLFAGVIAIIIVGLLANGYVNREEFSQLFGNRSYLYISLGLLLALLARGIVITYAMQKVFTRFGYLPLLFRYFNVFFEVTIPSVVIALLASQVNPANILSAPIVEIYFLFILLSVLEMDIRLSLFAGLLAGGEYLAIALYYLDAIQSPDTLPFFGFPVYYVGRTIIIVVAGVVAGLVGSLIRKRVLEVYAEREEKNKVEQLFGQQLSPEVAKELIHPKKDLEGISQKVCVMFLDIRGFTTLTAHMTPREIIAFQNSVFPFMIDMVYKHDGIINQVLGDGFMATFGAPVSVGNDCQHAVDAAQEILTILKTRNDKKRFHSVKIGIGLHFGKVVTGNVGSEIRKQYSVTGQTVIIASRIEQLNKDFESSFLVSDDVLENLDHVPEKMNKLGPIHLKGLERPIGIVKLG